VILYGLTYANHLPKAVDHRRLDQRMAKGASRGNTISAGLPASINKRHCVIKDGLAEFKGKRVLLLQGPLGPFFRRFASDLRGIGATIYKVNFNGGDWLFYPTDAVPFRQAPENWPIFFEQLVKQEKIDVVMLFGDCRPLHRTAHQISERLGLDVGVFEEGYIRPDYITLERYGVNANSLIPRNADFYRKAVVPPPSVPIKVGHTFWYAAKWAMLYYIASVLARPIFRHYRHHRPLALGETLPWLRAFWRKGYYAMKERGIEAELVASFSNKYFLVPLQVHNDAQIHTHSSFSSVEEFIEGLICSFIAHAPAETLLVIKHHPMDRGYHDYSNVIGDLVIGSGAGQRIIYIHDQHLPTLLNHARGVVVVNSTVGLSALHHDRRLKVCGSAIYDLPGLTFQGSLDDFWKTEHEECVDRELFRRFQHYLIEFTQLNGNFYKRLATPLMKSSIVWSLDPADVSHAEIKTEVETGMQARVAKDQSRLVEAEALTEGA
jgi:capsular polysaccharide export protein